MATKSKKLFALLLTTIIASAALAGCTDDSDDVTSSVTSRIASSTTTDSSKSADSSTTESSDSPINPDLIDLSDTATIQEIKDQLAKEAKENDGTIKIKLWCAAEDMAFEKSRIEEFKKKFADSRYKFNIAVVSKSDSDAGSKVIEDPKKAADVFNFADDQLSALQLAGDISSVADYYKGNVKAENTEDSIKVSSIGNELYAFPRTSDNGYFLYYDKRYITEDDIKDFDSLIAKAKSVGKDVFFNLTDAWYNTAFFFTAGVKIEYKNGVQTGTFDSPEGLSACKAMCHIAENEGSGLYGQGDNNTAVSQGFREGRLCAAVIGTWMGPTIKTAIGEENVGASKLPTVLMDNQQKQLHSFGGYKLIGVNVFAKCPFASQTLAYFLGNEASQLERYKTRGFIPTNIKGLESDNVKNDPAYKAINDQREFAHAQGASVGSTYWTSGVKGIGEKIINKKGSNSEEELKNLLKSTQKNLN